MAFGPNSNNPRERRAYAHTMIKKYKDGEASIEAAFDAAASGANSGKKGIDSHFGRAVGNLIIDSYSLNYDRERIVVSALSPRLAEQVEQLKESGVIFSYSPDLYLTKPGLNKDDLALGKALKNPLEAGFSVLQVADNDWRLNEVNPMVYVEESQTGQSINYQGVPFNPSDLDKGIYARI